MRKAIENTPPGIPDHILAWMQDQVRDRGPVPIADRIFEHGREYHECALRCLELRGNGQGFLFQPSLVLLAFVIEIYLKGLLAHEGKSAKIHEHDKLYGQLGGDAQVKIAARYTQRHHGQVLKADLPAYSKLFVDVRYCYEIDEPRTHDMSGVAQLASALYETWVELRPHLLRAGVVHDRITNQNQGVPIVGS